MKNERANNQEQLKKGTNNWISTVINMFFIFEGTVSTSVLVSNVSAAMWMDVGLSLQHFDIKNGIQTTR